MEITRREKGNDEERADMDTKKGGEMGEGMRMRI